MHGNHSPHVRLLQKEWPEQTHKRQISVHGIVLVIFSLLYFYCDKWICVLNIRHLLGSHCVLCAILEAMGTIDQKKLSLHLWQYLVCVLRRTFRARHWVYVKTRKWGWREAAGWAGLWKGQQYRQSACELYLVSLFLASYATSGKLLHQFEAQVVTC